MRSNYMCGKYNYCGHFCQYLGQTETRKNISTPKPSNTGIYIGSTLAGLIDLYSRLHGFNSIIDERHRNEHNFRDHVLTNNTF